MLTCRGRKFWYNKILLKPPGKHFSMLFQVLALVARLMDEEILNLGKIILRENFFKNFLFSLFS